MIRNLFCAFFTLWLVTAAAQNPSSVFRFPTKKIELPCGASCTTIKTVVPHIRQTDDYIVQAIPYLPYAYAANGTELTSLYADDIYSSAIPLPFSACFYGANYNSLVVASNGLLSFDVTNAGRRNNFRETVSFSNLTPVLLPYAGGNQNSLASTYYPKASIMGVYHDMFLFDNGSRRIEWRIEGTAPKRRFIASFKDVPMYSCTTLSTTHQMVIYESTGIVEVYMQDKPVCAAWNEGLAILGMQNFARNKASFPQGKNTGKWGTTGMNEAYRFIPAAGQSKFKKAELWLNGNLVANGDTASGQDGDLAVSFPNVCQTVDSVQYNVRVTYQSCTNPSAEVSFDDSIILVKENLQVSLQATDPTCTSMGSITVNVTGSGSGLVYQLNGGAPQQSPVFSNLAKGSYTVTVTTPSGCSSSANATLTLQDDLLLVVQPTVTLCEGELFTPQVLSNAAIYTWSPAIRVSNAAEAHPEISVQKNIAYTLTATKGVCQKTATMDVVAKPLPTVNAGPDQTIIEGDAMQLTGFISTGNFQWSPGTAVSASTVLNPMVSPAATTTFKLTATNQGCKASDEVTVTVVPYCVKPMEIFSPNHDGINDLWLVTAGPCLQKAKVAVFNRYGATVFQADDYKNNWDGKYNNQPLPDGTYYYVITYQLINGKTVSLKGNVTILR